MKLNSLLGAASLLPTLTRICSLLLAFGIAALAMPAKAATVADGDFSAWSFGSTFNPPSTASITREPTGGNPDARLNSSTFSGPTILGTAIKTDYSSSDALAGVPFTLSLDVLNGPDAFGDGQGVDFLVRQNGTIYSMGLGNTGSTHINWDTLTFNGTFNAGSFADLATGAAHPDFSGATPTQFGFGAGNTISSYLTMYYDNFSLQSAALSAIPEPETYAMLFAGLGLLGFIARRRRGR